MKQNAIQRGAERCVRSLHLVFHSSWCSSTAGATRQPCTINRVACQRRCCSTYGPSRTCFGNFLGDSLFIKFAAISRMAASDHVREPMLWSILIWSSVFSNAPAEFSHHTRWPSFSSADVTLKTAFVQDHGFGPFVEVGYISD
jgi:hypothetical protein